jgi:hypothetical protein
MSWADVLWLYGFHMPRKAFFPSIMSLWQCWDEGAYIMDVGQAPALRLINARWGSLKNQETKKGRLAAWRPRNDEKVALLKLIHELNP